MWLTKESLVKLVNMILLLSVINCLMAGILCSRYREYHVFCLLISSLSGKTRNSIGMERLAEPFGCVSGQVG